MWKVLYFYEKVHNFFALCHYTLEISSKEITLYRYEVETS